MVNELARVELAQVQNAQVATIAGEIDMSNAEKIGRLLEEHLARDADRHVVDLTATTYLDSAGVRILFALAERLRGRGRDLHVVVPETGPIHRVLEIVDIGSRACVHRRREDAFAPAGQSDD